MTPIETAEELRALLGAPNERAVNKERTRLLEIDRDWLRASSFCVLATSDEHGHLDASPKGDPAGSLVHVLDDTTIAIAERPGNKRADGYLNVLRNPHVGLIFIIPGRTDTLRVNGRARLVSDADFFDAMAVRERRPIMALVVEIEQIFFHCAKAFMRSGLWDHDQWAPEEIIPRRAVIAKQFENAPGTIEELDAYYGEAYKNGLY
jgi:PPOX class probable FMN-dependent enzyme